MKFTRRSRVVAALIALVSMLFMQLAMAAYACPPMQIVPVSDTHAAHAIASAYADDAGPAAHDGNAVALDHESMTGCEMAMESDDLPALCYGAAQFSSQSLAQSAPELPPAIPVLLIPVAGGIGDDALRLISPIAQSDQLMRDTSPPLSIRNCCFRI